MNVAVLGFGVVGSGVCEVLTKNEEQVEKSAGTALNLKYILDVREFPESPFAAHFVKDFAHIESDPSVAIVVETMGGVDAAYEFTKRALTAGKSVVTSNKELIAAHGCELMRLAQEHGASYLFEASVGGGIPIIRPLSQCLAANEITEICGILNGTTNFMLTRMIRNGLTFQQALSEAQAKGYAERDPAADVEGHDSCRKICILASLAYGWRIDPSNVPTEGILDVSLADIGYADSYECKIKLLGRAVRMGDGKICVYVAPHFVKRSDPLAGVEDVFNGITVSGDAVGDVMFYGRGAGKLPTASAVVADMIDIARGGTQFKQVLWTEAEEEMAISPALLSSAFYVRMKCSPDWAKSRFPGASMLARPGAPTDEVGFVTPVMFEGELREILKDETVYHVLRVL